MAVLAPLKGFATVGQVVDALQQAAKPHASAEQVRAAANQAKLDLDGLLRQANAQQERPGAAPQSAQLIARSNAQVKSALNRIVAADQSKNPADLLKGLQDVVQGLVNLVTSLLSSGGLPAADLPGLFKQS
ncbi:hypothetical protein NGB36_05475 [Streptomyces sp. RB6PN25]|uniref:Secreted protein n=1 Tax=Streptomyces humicola TaxID=2953240 RepID=A0ABT1PQV0_9ACTN|nr:hypothetical protein [Streptomyces humicola]MCQ4080055.1 hypothetical protein [Streptomyces humicola]